MKSKIIKSILFSTIGVLSTSTISSIALTSCGKKKQQTIPVTGVKIIENDLEIVENETNKFNVIVLPENATNKKVIWKSNDESVATVDQNGNVTAVCAGVFGPREATITVTTDDGGFHITRKVTVTANPSIDVLGQNYGTWGNIKVIYKLLSNHECRLLTKNDDGQNGYVDGAGVLRIPDHVVWNNQWYYVRRIPSNWSDGENNINGVEFESNVSHLEEICDDAFKGTDAIQNYHYKTLTFPEGLARIGHRAFRDTEYATTTDIINIVFPTSLIWIGEEAFANAGRFGINYSDDATMTFKGNFNPGNIGDRAFSPYTGKNVVKYICAPTMEIAANIANHIRECYPNDFETDNLYLVPKVIE